MGKHFFRSWLSILLFLCSLCQLEATERDSLFLIELHQKKFEYMIAVELDSLSTLLHPDLQYIHSNGWVESKEEVLENLESGYLSYNELIYKNAELRFYDRMAIITGIAEFNVALEGRPIIIDLLYSETWYKTDFGWQLAHRHSCRLIE